MELSERYFKRLCDFLPERAKTLSRETLREHARHMAMIRTQPLAAALMDELFETYVLPIHVNDEEIKPWATDFYKQLKPQLDGLNAYQAAIAINHWCTSEVHYSFNDASTAAAIDTYVRGYGRCGEESVFAVCAMRSVGIPARQCYAPRWSHCDDNHAWVEVYASNQWHFLGACEAEPVLNRGWFTHAASRAMLVHSRAAAYTSEDEVIGRKARDIVLNHTPRYAPSRAFTVRVTKNGSPLEQAHIRLEIMNYGVFLPIASGITGKDGSYRVTLGLGGIGVFVSYENHFRFVMVDTAQHSEVIIDIATPQRMGSHRYTQVAPQGLMPDDFRHPSEEEEFRRKACEARYDQKMASRPTPKWVTPPVPPPFGDSKLILHASEALIPNENLGVERFDGEKFIKLDFETRPIHSLRLPHGSYRIHTNRRRLDGTLDIHTEYLELAPGAVQTQTVTLPSAHHDSNLKDVPLNGIVDCGIIAYMEEKSEPAQHFLNEVESYAAKMQTLGMKIAIEDISRMDGGEVVLHHLQNAFDIGDRRLPFVIAVFRGRGVYAFANYNVGTVKQIIDLIDRLCNG